MRYRTQIKNLEAAYKEVYRTKAQPIEQRYQQLIPEKLQGKLELLAKLNSSSYSVISGSIKDYKLKAQVVSMYSFIDIPEQINITGLKHCLSREEIKLIEAILIPFIQEIENHASNVNQELEKLESEIDNLCAMAEGEAHLRSIISEYGDDCIPDYG